jgi:hypothetical protein
VSFHSAYDFGYLVKILRRSHVPTSLEEFFSIVRELFGSNVYDMKYVNFYLLFLGYARELVKDTKKVSFELKTKLFILYKY